MTNKSMLKNVFAFFLMLLTCNVHAIDSNTRILDLKASLLHKSNKLVFNDTIHIPKDNVSVLDDFFDLTPIKTIRFDSNGTSSCSLLTNQSFKSRSIEIDSEYGISEIEKASERMIRLSIVNPFNIPSNVRVLCIFENAEQATVGELESILKGIISIE